MNITVYCNIKDENQYLEQWINHCLSIGINKIVLYEDKGSKSHSRICNKYKEVTLIKHALDEYKTGHKDTDCWQDFIFRFGESEVDWVAKIDPDEYINCTNLSLDEILNYNVDQVFLWWKIHNANGRIEKPSKRKYDILSYYPNIICQDDIIPFGSNTSDNQFTLGKCFVRYNKARYISQLYNITPHLQFDPKKVKTVLMNCDKIWIDHYVCKSFEEFMWRLGVKGVSNPQYARKLGDFFSINPDMIDRIPEIEEKFHIKISDFETLTFTS